MKTSESCLNIPQLIVKPSDLQDCLDNVETVATGLGYPERGKLLRQTLERRLSAVREVVAASHAMNNCSDSDKKSSKMVTIPRKPRVALLEWCDPIMGCGYWLPELVRVAGGEPLHCPPPGGATPNISFQTLTDSKPDVVIFALCGFGLTRAAKELVQSWGQEKVEELLSIIPHRRVFVVDGNYLINRSGPRVVESAEALAEAIHPALTGHFGHYGTDLLSTLEVSLRLASSGVQTGSQKVRPEPFPQLRTTEGKLPDQTPNVTVEKQLKLLREQEFMKAFSINSVANQARWCSPDRFVAVLQSHPDFSRLLNDESTELGDVQIHGRVATVPVTLLEHDGLKTVKLLWTMIAEESSDATGTSFWRTEKVGMAH